MLLFILIFFTITFFLSPFFTWNFFSLEATDAIFKDELFVAACVTETVGVIDTSTFAESAFGMELVAFDPSGEVLEGDLRDGRSAGSADNGAALDRGWISDSTAAGVVLVVALLLVLAATEVAEVVLELPDSAVFDDCLVWSLFIVDRQVSAIHSKAKSV